MANRLPDIRGVTNDQSDKGNRLNFQNIDFSLRDIGRKIKEIGKSMSAQSSNATPVGTIHNYIGATAPDGYMLCNGDAISRTTYSVLFQLIGTTYGSGDGSTTFNIPNLAGRFLRNTGGNAGALGELQTSQNKSHTHPLPLHTHFIASNAASASLFVGTGGDYLAEHGLAGDYRLCGIDTPEPTLGKTSGSSGFTDTSGLVTETRPDNMAVNFILKVL